MSGRASSRRSPVPVWTIHAVLRTPLAVEGATTVQDRLTVVRPVTILAVYRHSGRANPALFVGLRLEIGIGPSVGLASAISTAIHYIETAANEAGDLGAKVVEAHGWAEEVAP